MTTGFVMPTFSAAADWRDNYGRLMREVGLLSGTDLDALVQAEVAFDALVPKFLVDGEEFTVTETNRTLATFAYAQSKEVGWHSFRVTPKMRENFINYLTRRVAWDVFVHPSRYPLHDRMLRKSADVEVVVRQPVDA